MGFMNINALLETLPTSLWGMLGIFIVITVIYIAVKALCKIFKN